jgi:uncharacterized protein YlxW (UPF0749 family)
MDKKISQISIAIVCLFLGFILTYEFKLLRSDKIFSTSEYAKGTEISEELETVKKQRNELTIKNNELKTQFKSYQDNITDEQELKNQIDKEIANSNLLLGFNPVEGAGITVTITPTGSTIGDSSMTSLIDDEVLLYIVNELKFAGAEAIAINDKRITSQSGIKSIDTNTILINDEKVSPKGKLEISAIGDKVKLQSALSFAGVIEGIIPHSYATTISPRDSIKISKYTKSYKSINMVSSK